MSTFKIISQEFLNEFHSAATPVLTGQVGDRITATLKVVFDGHVYATPATPFTFGFPNPSLPSSAQYLICNNPIMNSFSVGDTISVEGTGTANDGYTGTVQEIVNPTTFIMDTPFAPTTATAGAIVNTTPLEGLKFGYGVTPDVFPFALTSATTNEQQAFTFDGYLTTSTAIETMNAIGSQSWQSVNETCTVQRLSTGTGKVDQAFKVVHTFEIQPQFKVEILNSLTGEIVPNEFVDSKTLKYNFQFSAARDLSNPNKFKVTPTFNNVGNVGWYKENLNGNIPAYKIDTITFKRLPSNDIIDAIELTTDEQLMEIRVISNTATLMDLVDQEFRVSHTYFPQTSAEYIANGKTLDENQYLDRFFGKVALAAAAGDNFGTDFGCFKEVSAVVEPAGDAMNITVKIQMPQAMIDDLQTRPSQRFLVAVAAARHDIPASSTNLTSDYITGIYNVDTFEANLFQLQTTFLNHYEVDPYTEGTNEATGRIEDDLLTYTSLILDRTNNETSDVDIKNVIAEVIAEKNDGTFFVLESYTKSFSGLPFVNGEKFLDVVQERPFKMPSGEQRKEIRVRRNSSLDTGLLKFYELFYPFRMRFEEWEQLDTVSDDFFDTAEPNNGKNNLWNRFAADANHDLYFKARIQSTLNGEPQNHEVKGLINSFTYNANADWTTEGIQAFDSNNNELTFGGEKYLTLFEDMTIRSEFTDAGTSSPTTTDIVIVFKIDLYRQGTIFDTRYFTSEFNWTQFSYFTSIDQSGKVVVTNPSANVFRGECILKTNELPQAAEFSISARYYNKLEELPANAKLLEDGTIKLKEDGSIKLLD